MERRPPHQGICQQGATARACCTAPAPDRSLHASVRMWPDALASLHQFCSFSVLHHHALSPVQLGRPHAPAAVECKADAVSCAVVRKWRT